MTKKVKFKVNAAIGGKVAGQIVTLECDKAGTPLDSFWRRRLRDSASDNCMELYKEAKPKPVSKPKKSSQSANPENQESENTSGEK